MSTVDVSNPPTISELDATYGSASAHVAGYTQYIDDNGADTNVYQVVSTGTSWHIFSATKAV